MAEALSTSRLAVADSHSDLPSVVHNHARSYESLPGTERGGESG